MRGNGIKCVLFFTARFTITSLHTINILWYCCKDYSCTGYVMCENLGDTVKKDGSLNAKHRLHASLTIQKHIWLTILLKSLSVAKFEPPECLNHQTAAKHHWRATIFFCAFQMLCAVYNPHLVADTVQNQRVKNLLSPEHLRRFMKGANNSRRNTLSIP